MRILIVGAGALGGLVGAKLSAAGEDVVMLEINKARASLLNEEGLYISQEGQEEVCIPVRVVTRVDELDPMDLIFVSVKSYQTEDAIKAVLPLIEDSTRVLSMQNGLGNAEVMADIIGREKVLSGITYHSIQHTGPNRLRYRGGIKPIQIAPLDGVLTPTLEAIGDVFQKAGLDTKVVDNIDHSVWQKLLHNAVVNPTSALTGLTCREMLADEDLMDFMRTLCGEIVEVMRARGIPIVDEDDPFRPVIGSLKALGKNRPSMWQDLARGNRTEVDAIVGSVEVEARKHGLKAAHCWALTRFIRSRERQKILRRKELLETVEIVSATPRERAVRATPLGEGGGMPSGRVPLKTTSMLKKLLREHYQGLQEAGDDPQRMVGCTSALGPVEVLRAFDMAPYVPENHAALIGATRQSGQYIRRATAAGFSQFVNSAMACDIGAMLAGDSPLVSAYGVAGPPRPDVVVYNTNNGHPLINWFEYYGRHFKIPVLGLHPPAALDRVERIEVDVAVQQMQRMIARLEEISGKKLDYDRLAEIVGRSRRAAALWSEILALAQNVPSPVTFFDLLIHVAPMVLLRGTPEAVDYYQALKAELEHRVCEHHAAVPGERHRFYWEGPPIWCALRPLANLFLENQVAVVSATFCEAFAFSELDEDNPIESMARSYTGIFPNRSDDYKAAYLRDKFRAFGVDGVIYHEGRTCPEHSNVRYGLEVRLRKETGLPSLVIEADSHDLRLFQPGPFESQLYEFIEASARSRNSGEALST